MYENIYLSEHTLDASFYECQCHALKSFFTDKLSQKLRHVRWLRKKRASDESYSKPTKLGPSKVSTFAAFPNSGMAQIISLFTIWCFQVCCYYYKFTNIICICKIWLQGSCPQVKKHDGRRLKLNESLHGAIIVNLVTKICILFAIGYPQLSGISLFHLAYSHNCCVDEPLHTQQLLYNSAAR